MNKTAILSKGVTPCEKCGNTSTTMIGGEYLCESCGNELSAKLAEENVIPRPFTSSLRGIIMEVENK